MKYLYKNNLTISTQAKNIVWEGLQKWQEKNIIMIIVKIKIIYYIYTATLKEWKIYVW